ncbi:late embryogenesis abundant protein [Striga asiatica]|uniref:Late embryogenesis abundant protein n=1 Tax=Striga asiatica TaxID=4170 RepID=A0A5A7REY2_STRAF|nr:late embryogenesis abundant protein [Striga asiatica]
MHLPVRNRRRIGAGLAVPNPRAHRLQVKRPRTSVDFVSLEDLDSSFDFARLRLHLNLTLDLRISVTNPNRVGFRYTTSTALLRYRGGEVGQVPVPAGRIGSRDTHTLNLTLTLMADRLLTNSAVYSDAISGTLPLQTYVRLAGKVRILFNFHVVTYTTCDLEIALLNRTVIARGEIKKKEKRDMFGEEINEREEKISYQRYAIILEGNLV